MRLPLLASVVLLAVAATACAPLRSHQGYVVDPDLLNSVQPGVDNRQSVLATLGHPSFSSQFGQGDWYYISRDTRNYAFNTPKVREQLTVQISFDQAGNVSAIRKWGAEQVASIKPARRTTPTLGRKRGFFEDLFGNIGAVGTAGAGGPGGGRTGP